MTEAPWNTSWFDRWVANKAMLVWRGVEAQHVVSTMRLADTTEEQDMLEQLLEHSKPPMPAMKVPKHYLLATPFRYRPQHASRFRRAGTLGLWYGAEELFAACAEVAYWRHRFIVDSAAFLNTELLTEHTFYQAKVEGRAIDLMQEPWVAASAAWTHSSDYTETQAVADAARDRDVKWICYESVRAPSKRCAAVLDVEALEMVDQGNTQQTWHCKATRESVMLVHGTVRHVWAF
jgi:hypothetical protein